MIGKGPRNIQFLVQKTGQISWGMQAGPLELAAIGMG
jgi:hypothetical protein